MSDKTKRGTKRTCQSCESRFYDLNRDPITCPLCEAPFVVEVKARSSADLEEAKPKVKVPVKDFPVEEGLPLGEDLPEIAEGDELADIETDDAAEIEPAADDDTFLEEEETGTDVGGLIDSPIEGEDGDPA
jgi:uncharacterized protein (TIGR02300 family)